MITFFCPTCYDRLIVAESNDALYCRDCGDPMVELTCQRCHEVEPLDGSDYCAKCEQAINADAWAEDVRTGLREIARYERECDGTAELDRTKEDRKHDGL